MEELKSKYINFKKAHAALGRTIKTRIAFVSASPDVEDMREALDLAVIKAFELTYETSWKFLKAYLTTFGESEAQSPKAVFRECYKRNVLPQGLVDELVLLVEVRNETTHTYDQKRALNVCNDILKHHTVLGKILELIPPQNN